MQKKIIIVLIITLVFLGGCGNEAGQEVQFDIENMQEKTEEQKQKKEEQEKVLASLEGFYDEVNHANYDEILEKGGNNLYYFYQETCSHCNELKPTMKEFNDELVDQSEINLYFVDMLEDQNKEGWDNSKTYDVEDIEAMKELEDIKIVGTPTMIYVKDYEVIAYGVGEDQIKEIMSDIKNEYNI